MTIEINNFDNSTTVAEIKKHIADKENKQREVENEYREFLNSFVGKYIFCDFNDTNGFVALLKSWNNNQEVIYCDSCSIYKVSRMINHLWVLHPFASTSKDHIKIITQEQYFEVESICNKIQDLRKSVKLFKNEH